MGGWEAITLVVVEPPLKYHPSRVLSLTVRRDPASEQRLVGSLTGAVASQKVTEAPKGALRWNGNPPVSANAQGRLTVRHTRRTEAKAGVSDPTVLSGKAVD